MNDHVNEWLEELRTTNVKVNDMEQVINIDRRMLMNKDFREQWVQFKGRTGVLSKLIENTVSSEILEILQVYDLTIAESINIMDYVKKVMFSKSRWSISD